MNDIICPHCTKAFKIDETGYANIVKQIHDKEFEQQLSSRLELAEREKKSAVILANTQAQSLLQKTTAEKDAAIFALQTKFEASNTARDIAVSSAIAEIERERDSLLNKLAQAKLDYQSASELSAAKVLSELQTTAAQKDAVIQDLNAKLNAVEVEQRLALKEAISEIERERDTLKSGLERSVIERQLAEAALKDKYQTQIKDRDDAIERLRDMKAKLSTKMVGETLEQHCETEFNRIRATAFPRAYFEKDNDSRTGSKGDYIFKDSNEEGTEIVSIMFEMKNEADRTATKQKNEDFLKELDKDRVEKGCEYAVLVSLLEPESDLYNTGIVDVFFRYPKMYVIRPQFFIPIITLLRNAAMNALKYKSELALVRSQNIDITNFESQLEVFKTGFSRNYDLASRQFETAIDEIDKSMSHMQKTKDALLKTANNLRLANEKAQDVTIKRLTKGNQTMADKFSEISTAKESPSGA
uniref:DUF2130 domain-containing protein n=1 Tax=Flavobacterium sp. TaxID=239 RepID=UPI0040487F67